MSANPTLLSLPEKVQKAAGIVEAIPGLVDELRLQPPYNDGKMKASQVAERFIWERLKLLGVYDDEVSHDLLMSSDLREGDARHEFCEHLDPKIPVPRFRRVFAILRESNVDPDEAGPIDYAALGRVPDSELVDGIANAMQAMKPIGQWTDKELLDQYGPDGDTQVAEELDKRAKGRPFVMYTNEAECTIDVEGTLRMLKEARRRETPVHYKVADSLRRLFRATEFPSGFYYECPFHPGVLLFDGYCDECGYTWKDVEYDVRQFARIVQEMDEQPEKGPSIRQFVHTAHAEGIEGLEADYPKVAVEFRKRQEVDKLPSLKSRESGGSSTAVADPFGGNTRY